MSPKVSDKIALIEDRINLCRFAIDNGDFSAFGVAGKNAVNTVLNDALNDLRDVREEMKNWNIHVTKSSVFQGPVNE